LNALDTKLGSCEELLTALKMSPKEFYSRISKLRKTSIDTEYCLGKEPMGLAAAVMYAACRKTDEHISQKEIAKAAL
jgi:transcription initiation factor TFIIIB Brf1 subunit/transcription initiation factor TFIIB